MGFFSQVANRIRQAWVKDKESVPLQLAKGAAPGGYPSSGHDLLNAYGYDALGDYLQLEQDLLSRYVDYEEMDDYPPISAALTIFADDATQPDTQLHRTVWATSSDKSVQTALDDLFNKRLRLDEEIWEIARTVCKYGQDYEELLVTPQGVVGLNFLPPPTVRRIEGPRGELFGFVQDFQGRFGFSPEEFKTVLAQRTSAMAGAATPGERSAQGIDPSLTALEDWEVVHFRLRGRHRRSIYGFSVLEASRWIWKRLLLLEDSALLYRLTRAPERFAFYVDVGDMPGAQAMAHLHKIRQQYKKKKFVNPATGQLDQRYNPLGMDEDIFLPTRNGQDGTRVETLAGPVWQHMEDIEYFLNHLFSALQVPKAYLAQDENTARAVLSTEDVRFARSVLRVQRELQNGLRKVCRVHLAALGIDPFSVDYEVNMTVPSAIFELAQLEVRNARADLASRLKEFFSFYWLYKNVFGLSDDEIHTLNQGRETDVMDETMWSAKAQAEAEKLAGGEGGGGGGGGGGPPGLQMSRGFVLPSRRRVHGPGRGTMSEKELFKGAGSDSEKRATEKFDQLMRTDQRLRSSLSELQQTVTQLAHSARRPPSRRK